MCKISGLVVAIVDAGEITQKFIENIKQIIQQSEQVLIVYTKGQKSSLDQCRNGCSRMFQVLLFAVISWYILFYYTLYLILFFKFRVPLFFIVIYRVIKKTYPPSRAEIKNPPGKLSTSFSNTTYLDIIWRFSFTARHYLCLYDSYCKMNHVSIFGVLLKSYFCRLRQNLT